MRRNLTRLRNDRRRRPGPIAPKIAWPLWLCALGVATSWSAAPGQDRAPTEGTPLTRFVSSTEIGCHPQVFSVAVTGGALVIGHGAGLAWFDGHEWAPIPGAPAGAIPALTALDDGRVVVCALGDVGLVETNRDGALAYRSLLGDVDVPDDAYARQVVVRADGSLVIRFGDGLLLLDRSSDGFTPYVSPDYPFDNRSTWVRHVARLGERILFTRNGGGLFELRGRTAVALSGGKPLAPLRITGLAALDDARLLIATFGEGLHVWSANGLEPVGGPLGQFAAKRTLTSLTAHEGSFLLGTDRGVAIVGRDLALVDLFLQSDDGVAIDALGPPTRDAEGGWWFGALGGAVRIELDTAFRIVDRRHGLQGAIRSIHRHQGVLYAGTTHGLYRLHRAGPLDARTTATRVGGIGGGVRDLESHAGHLVVACKTGLIAVDATGRATVLYKRGAVLELAATPDGRRFAAGPNVFFEYAFNDGAWTTVRGRRTRLPFVDALTADGPGRVWFTAHADDRPYRVGYVDVTTTAFKTRLIVPDAKPGHTALIKWRDTLLAGTPTEVLAFDPDSDAFVRSHPLTALLREHGHGAMNLAVDATDALWFWRARGRSGRVREMDGALGLDDPLRRIGAADVHTFHAEPGGVVWAGTAEGRLVRFDPDAVRAYRLHPARIRMTLRFPDRARWITARTLEIDEERSAFDALCVLPRLAEPGATRIQTRLAGFDDAWRPWTRSRRREITGLTAGEYELAVRARDVHGEISTARLRLRVVRPWYRTTAAIGVYALLLSIVAASFVRWRVAVARARVRRLAAEVERREATEQRLRTEIDEHMKTASQRERLQKKLRETQRLEALGRMAGGVAHDLNNILTAVIGEVDLAKTMHPTMAKDLADRLSRVDDAADRATVLTRQLLAFGRSQLLRPEVVDMNASIHALEPMLSRLLRASTELRLALDPDAGHVRVDRGQFEQVVVNLALNADEAMPDGGRLTITTRARSDRESQLRVTDTGVGMPAQVQDEMFDPFFTTKHATGGTGLGLSIVHGIVNQSGGCIDVESKEGHGTRIAVTLPRCAPDDRAATVDATPGGRALDRTATVLVCDDDAAILRIVAEILENAGHRTLLADGPGQAIAAARAAEERIDLLVTDVVMPGGTGVDVADALRRDLEGLAVIYMSGYAMQTLHQRIEENDRTVFLAKPFDADTLLDHIGRLLAPARTGGPLPG